VTWSRTVGEGAPAAAGRAARIRRPRRNPPLPR
jgi:hypothetical protein